MGKLLNRLISGKVQKKKLNVNVNMDFRQHYQSLKPVGCILKHHTCQDAEKSQNF